MTNYARVALFFEKSIGLKTTFLRLNQKCVADFSTNESKKDLRNKFFSLRIEMDFRRKALSKKKRPFRRFFSL